ncbi:hypothetical protein N665_0056s0027 [Sinapis alba]|nr:hypothetical protein N665_0056s0027 [Sinapis alba]
MTDGDGGNPTDDGGGGASRSPVSAAPRALTPQGVSASSPPETRSAAWSKNRSSEVLPRIDISDGVALIQIPEAIFDESELLWKSFVVGYFIGDAPHVGSIHATVNRIWSSPKSGSKIDVQFIDKNTVLFRIDNSQMRTRVLNRKYWHISDVPLVVNEWSPESALTPPDLSAMPLWIDLKGVPNGLFSHKGLKCLTSAVGKFVKLHPHTERCTRLDVARILAEIDLHQHLVEKIVFQDKDGVNREIEVSFPWLPSRCAICQGWGHKGSECKNTSIRILQRVDEVEKEASFGQDPSVEAPASDSGGMFGLLKELEALPRGDSLPEPSSSKPKETGPDEVLRITLSEPMTEVFPAVEDESWSRVYGKGNTGNESVVQITRSSIEKQTDEATIEVSPSRFSPLMGMEEEELVVADGGAGEDEIDVEEGEITGEAERSCARVPTGGKKIPATQSHKMSRQRIVRAKDLKFVGRQGNSKKTSVRKL